MLVKHGKTPNRNLSPNTVITLTNTDRPLRWRPANFSASDSNRTDLDGMAVMHSRSIQKLMRLVEGGDLGNWTGSGCM